MKIFDCFMYFDEEIVLDTRLNYLNQYVDYFVIVESCFTHKGEKEIYVSILIDLKNLETKLYIKFLILLRKYQ